MIIFLGEAFPRKLKSKKMNLLNFSKNKSDFNRASVPLENQSLERHVIGNHS